MKEKNTIFEEQYLQKFNTFFSTAKFSSTYKLVFLKSLMDIGDYVESDPTSVLGHKWLKLSNGILNVDLNFIAVRYAKYYWNMFYKFRLKQSQNPDDVNIHQFFQKDKNPIKPPTLSQISTEEYDELRKNVISLSIRPQVLKFLISEIDFYKRILNKPFIEFDSRVVEFFKKYRGILMPALNYELTRYLEKINHSPRISEKVLGKIPRDYLTIKEKNHLMKFHKECFYCKEKFESYDYDHVVPFDYVFNTEVFNCVPACNSCNSSKSNRLPTQEIFDKVILRNKKFQNPKEYSDEWYQKLYDNCLIEYHGNRPFFVSKYEN